MEAVDEMAAPSVGLNINNKDLSPIAKGKRTKRHRPHSPTPFTIRNSHHTFPAAVSFSEDSTTTEEEDTARCLILLSRGHFSNHPSTPNHVYNQFHNSKHKKNMETTTKTTSPGTCMYTCKTCDRSFSSFQALGGHRASHKKPKNEKKLANNDDFPSPSSNSLSLQLSNISTSTTTFSGIPKSSPSPRIHVCSYCGAEFTSGQALGGHMRRHRGGPISPLLNAPLATATIVSDRTVLSLDLNLPAPEDFGFAGSSVREAQNEPTVHLGLSTTTTASTLVDCHY